MASTKNTLELIAMLTNGRQIEEWAEHLPAAGEERDHYMAVSQGLILRNQYKLWDVVKVLAILVGVVTIVVTWLATAHVTVEWMRTSVGVIGTLFGLAMTLWGVRR